LCHSAVTTTDQDFQQATCWHPRT